MDRIEHATRLFHRGRRDHAALPLEGEAVSLPPAWKLALSRSVLVLALALGMTVLFHPSALAADGEIPSDSVQGENLVDPTQRADNSFIYDTTIESLTEQATLYDDRTVQVVGEVIGDRIAADEKGFCWITLTVIDAEDKTSISILISDEQANQIDHYGKYGVTGTILQVRGTYHQTCGEHDSLPDIHATDSTVMSRGVEHFDTFDPTDFLPGLIAIIIGLGLMIVFYFARERTR